MIISVQANFDSCAMSLGETAPCAPAAPNLTITSASVVYSNSSILMYDGQEPIDATINPWVLDDDIEQPLYNLLQAVDACIGVELGNPRPNNFILNPSFLNNTIIQKFPTTRWNPDIDYENYSGLYHGWAQPDPIFKSYLPVNTSGPANIQVVYPCQFQKPKSPGSLFVSVLVATLGMFSTGWALFILIASTLAKQTDPVGGTSHLPVFTSHSVLISCRPQPTDAAGMVGGTDHPSNQVIVIVLNFGERMQDPQIFQRSLRISHSNFRHDERRSICKERNSHCQVGS